jgi:hypothetical protein
MKLLLLYTVPYKAGPKNVRGGTEVRAAWKMEVRASKYQQPRFKIVFGFWKVVTVNVLMFKKVGFVNFDTECCIFTLVTLII